MIKGAKEAELMADPARSTQTALRGLQFERHGSLRYICRLSSLWTERYPASRLLKLSWKKRDGRYVYEAELLTKERRCSRAKF